MLRSLLTYLRHHHLALLALFVALGGTSYAAVKLPPNSVGSREIRSGAVGAAELRLDGVTSAKVRDGSLLRRDFLPGLLRTTHFARVSSMGALISGTPGAKVTRLSDGAYEISWSSASLSSCAAVATVSGDGWARREAASGANWVGVQTREPFGQPTDLPFDVIVVC